MREETSTQCVLGSAQCSARDQKFLSMLSERLVRELRTSERNLVKENCGGTYIEGFICGFDYNPITNGQDCSDYYLYRTVHDGRDEKIIEKSKQNTYKIIIDRYKVILKNNAWVLDDIKRGASSLFIS